MKRKILIVDDDVSFSITLKTFLVRQGFETDEAFSSQKAMEKVLSTPYDVILTDFRLPDKNGIELLKSIKEKTPNSLVILMTAYADIRMAVKAIKHGAYEYIAKPVNPDELLSHIKSGLERIAEPPAGDSNKRERSFNSNLPALEYLEASSKESKVIHEHIDLVASTNMSVIIQGESGTGKEYIARRIHEKSLRNSKPFVAVDCGALSRDLAGSEFFGHIKGSFTGAIQDKTGQFEAANLGTLFLDEIGNLSYEIQMKLLRAIQERKIRKIGSNTNIPVDVRIIVATNEDLQKEVQKGNFREDLYHRLNEFSIMVPPLRERKADIPLFVLHFLTLANQELNRNVTKIPDSLMEILMNYSWPGNIREVKNVIKRAVLLSKGEELDKSALPKEIIFSQMMGQNAPIENENDLKSQTGKTEKEIILATLQKAKFNKSYAAKLLNIDRRTLYNKLKQYGISLD
ncbi:MAG: sigma-54 dependent transcriptional regulator [Bacteroides sp.]|jgi:two-component system response regulator HydG|nr:sigma-54 dependent transcriptional regulator [Bacteroides sp.]